jgi:hypothetical protein
MSSAAISAIARVAPVSSGSSGPLAGGAAPASAMRPDSHDLGLFRLAMQAPSGAGPALKPAGPAPLGALSNYLNRQQRGIADQMARVQVTRDPAAMLQVTNELIDQGAQSDLIAKVIGKTVSAVDQLTKLN